MVKRLENRDAGAPARRRCQPQALGEGDGVVVGPMSHQQAAGEAGDGAKRREAVEGLSTRPGELVQQGGHLVLATVEREGEDDAPVRHELALEMAGVLFGVGEPPFGDAVAEAAVLVMLDETAHQGQPLPAIVRERLLEIAASLEGANEANGPLSAACYRRDSTKD